MGSVGLQKGENYAMLKMEEGPSDNEEWMIKLISLSLIKYKFLINRKTYITKNINNLIIAIQR